MSEIYSTSISDLPSANGNGNVHLVINEKESVGTNHNSNSSALSLDQSTISQIVNGLQQASLTGATSLPSRDIPLTTNQMTNDAQVQPNYIPPPPVNNNNYIAENDEDASKYHKKEKRETWMDRFYDEMHTPVMLSVLYFLFQLPFFKKLLYQYMSFLFHNDGNYNLNGLLFTSLMFGVIYHIFNIFLISFSKF